MSMVRWRSWAAWYTRGRGKGGGGAAAERIFGFFVFVSRSGREGGQVPDCLSVVP